MLSKLTALIPITAKLDTMSTFLLSVAALISALAILIASRERTRETEISTLADSMEIVNAIEGAILSLELANVKTCQALLVSGDADANALDYVKAHLQIGRDFRYSTLDGSEIFRAQYQTISEKLNALSFDLGAKSSKAQYLNAQGAFDEIRYALHHLSNTAEDVIISDQKLTVGTFLTTDIFAAMAVMLAGLLLAYSILNLLHGERHILHSSHAQNMKQMENVGLAFAAYKHRIYNIFAAMSLPMQVLANKDLPLDSKEMALRALVDGFNELNATIENLHNTDKLSELSWGLERVKLQDIVREIQSNSEKFVTWDVRPEAEEVEVEKSGYKLILTELLDNAVKATTKTPQRSVKIKITRASDKLLIKCSNACAKQTRQTVKSMTLPFYTTKRKQNALNGLGLFSIKTMAYKKGGTFHVGYQPNWLTVTVQLPIDDMETLDAR